jgi:hypothetical protein
MSMIFYFKDPCPKCSKPIMHAVVEPHPSSRDLAIHKLNCADCGPIKTILLSLKPPVKSPPGLENVLISSSRFRPPNFL